MTTRIEKLKACNSKPDFARLLELTWFYGPVSYIYEILTIYIHSSTIKRMVLDRVISAPDSELKEIQSKLSDLLHKTV